MNKISATMKCYIQPTIEVVNLRSESGIMQDDIVIVTFSGGAPNEGIVIDPDADDGDGMNRLPYFNAWDDMQL